MTAGPVAAVRSWWRRRHATGRPLPEVRVGLGRTAPGWLLRAAFVVAVPALLLGAASRTTLAPELTVTLAVVVAVWAALRPGAAPAHVALVTAAVLLLGSTSAPFDPAVLWLAPLAHVTTRLGWWAAHVSARDRVELAALARASGRDVLLVAAALAVGAVAWAVAGRPLEWLVGLGVAALAALAWTVVRRDDGGAR